MLSSLNPFFFQSLTTEWCFSDNAGVYDPGIQEERRAHAPDCYPASSHLVRGTISPHRSIPAPQPMTALGILWLVSIPMPSPMRVLPGMTRRNAAVVVPHLAPYCIASSSIGYWACCSGFAVIGMP